MTQPVVSISVESHFVPCCLENIIDKKVNGVALNRFEKFVDWLCNQIYHPYRTVYEKKMSRVHVFNGGVKLFDNTQSKVTNICDDFICLGKRKVHFYKDKETKKVFSRDWYQYVEIRDNPRNTGCYYIKLPQIPNPGKPPMEEWWSVNAISTNSSLEAVPEPLKP